MTLQAFITLHNQVLPSNQLPLPMCFSYTGWKDIIDDISVKEKHGSPSIENFDINYWDDDDDTNDEADIIQQDAIGNDRGDPMIVLS